MNTDQDKKEAGRLDGVIPRGPGKKKIYSKCASRMTTRSSARTHENEDVQHEAEHHTGSADIRAPEISTAPQDFQHLFPVYSSEEDKESPHVIPDINLPGHATHMYSI